MKLTLSLNNDAKYNSCLVKNFFLFLIPLILVICSCSSKSESNIVENQLYIFNKIKENNNSIESRYKLDSLIFQSSLAAITRMENSLLEYIEEDVKNAFSDGIIYVHFRGGRDYGPLLQSLLYNNEYKDHWLLQKYGFDKKNWLDKYVNKAYPINVLILLAILKQDLLSVTFMEGTDYTPTSTTIP